MEEIAQEENLPMWTERDIVAVDPTVGIRTPKVPQRRPNPLSHREVRMAFKACRDSQDRLAIGRGSPGRTRGYAMRSMIASLLLMTALGAWGCP